MKIERFEDFEVWQPSITKLRKYIESENFKGYDPYDTLNSKFPFKLFGKWSPVLAIQFQKRNPVNIRSLLGIKKEINPKAFGLFLSAYSVLYKFNPKREYLEKAEFFFKWLRENYSKGYSGVCWGYNFPWASPGKFLKPFVPSAVVTGFVCKGIFEYYKITKDPEAIELLRSASDFILKDLPVTEDDSGLCFSYTPVKKDICFNASLLAIEILARTYYFTKERSLLENIKKGINFVISKQKDDGRWNYSIDPKTGKEREQVDFHQGYVLESLDEIRRLADLKIDEIDRAIIKGAEFYRREQFFDDGRSKWRIPKEWPVDIHNQAQGIITFTKLSYLNSEYLLFAKKIAEWTIDNMQDKSGYFYFRKGRFMTNKISYMRWSNAWMLLALTELLIKLKK